MPYAELHAKTNFSFLRGASHPDELVARAAELHYAALAVTDRNSLAGVVRAHGAAKDLGLKLVVGAEITPDDALPLVLWAPDRAAYGRLAQLITVGCRRAVKGQCRLSLSDIAEHAAGLLAGVLAGEPGGFQAISRGLSAAIPPVATQRGARDPGGVTEQPCCDPSGVSEEATIGTPGRTARPGANSWHPSGMAPHLSHYRDIFGDRCYLLAELHRGPDDRGELGRLVALARACRVPLAAAGDVHYHVAARQALCDVLTAVRLGTTVAAAREHLFPNAQRYLREPAEMAALFARAPEALAHTREIAERCTFSLDELRYEYPEELAPPGETPSSYLTRLTWAGAGERYPQGVPDKVRALLEHELALIAELHYEAYFLTVWDLVHFARGRGILCQGRGSAANSAVCFCLGITSVDPERMDVLFERFISRERNEAPDIDVDFEHERREEVLQYLYQKYGRQRAGMTAEVISYRPRSAVRDVAKALGLPQEQIERLAKGMEHYRDEGTGPIFGETALNSEETVGRKLGPVPFAGLLAQRCVEAGVDPQHDPGRQLIELVPQVLGFPRHLSQHTGGMVMTRGPLDELVPIENAAMPERTVIQWNKDDLDELGMLKVDCLALGMLTAIRKCFALVALHHGRQLSLANIPPEDADVYAMICRADTMGVFQIESRAQMSMLPRLQPRSFYDLVIEVAIVRPGPIQGNMVHPYLRRRRGDEAVTYPNEVVRRVLEKTLGIPLFQEQAMRLAVEAAGFTPGEADQLRRAMGAWRRPGLIEQFRQRLIGGMLQRNFSREYAEAVFTQIRGFGDYGFPESHATSFALLVYVSAWLKYHYPAAFTAALLNSQPMGFYAPPQLVRDARQHGVSVLPVDVNASDVECTLEHDNLRLGFCMLSGLAGEHARRIVAARGPGPFHTLDDFARRTGLGKPVLARLAKAGAFGTLAHNRRESLWQALGQNGRKLPLFDTACSGEAEGDPSVPLPAMTPAEEVLADYRSSGLSLRAHPLEFLRHTLDDLQIVPAAGLKTWPNGKPVRVAGIVLVRQRPSTAKGITFVTLEDETGTANLIIRPGVWKRYRPAALAATLLLATGQLQREGEVIHVLTTSLEDLSDHLRGLDSQSRDFC